jgi:hypothetical protein
MKEADVIAALSGFSYAARQHLVQKIRALDAVEGKPTANLSQEALPDDWLFDGIIEVLRERHMLLRQPSAKQLRSMPVWRSYCEKSEELRQHIEHQLPEPATRIERQILGKLLARCLARRVERFMPVSMASMMRFTHLALEGLEEQFPHYLAAGKLTWVLHAQTIHG